MRKVLTPLFNAPVSRKLVGYLAEGALFRPHCLFFHGVEEKIVDERIQVMQIELKRFEAMLHYLKRKFCLINLDEYYERMLSRDEDLSRCVMITFDDGYESNFNLAAPVMESLDIPFTIYLTTSAIGTNDRLPTFKARAAISYTEEKSISLPGHAEPYSLRTNAERDYATNQVVGFLKTESAAAVRELVERLTALLPEDRWDEIRARFSSDAFMGWDQVRDLHQRGAVIGSHGHEHFPLHSKIEPEEIEKQLKTSRDLIEDQVGECRHYAFPNGTESDISPRSLTALGRLGFQTGATTFPAALDLHSNPFLIPRICVYEPKSFQNRILRGWIDRSQSKLRAWQASKLADSPESEF